MQMVIFLRCAGQVYCHHLVLTLDDAELNEDKYNWQHHETQVLRVGLQHSCAENSEPQHFPPAGKQ